MPGSTNCLLEQLLAKQCEANELLQTLCEKMIADNTTEESILQKLCNIDEGINGNCPMELVAPLTTTTAVVAGDQTAANPPGSEFEVTDAAGNAIGTANVVSATYNAATDQTTFTLSANTVPAAQLASATAVKKQRTVAARVGGEGVARAAVKTAIKAQLDSGEEKAKEEVAVASERTRS